MFKEYLKRNKVKVICLSIYTVIALSFAMYFVYILHTNADLRLKVGIGLAASYQLYTCMRDIVDLGLGYVEVKKEREKEPLFIRINDNNHDA